MLVLSRRRDEQILFPELGITVKVISLEGNRVRIGIEAPDSIRILRGELGDTLAGIPAEPMLNLFAEPQNEWSEQPVAGSF